jgi:hypothetical protein
MNDFPDANFSFIDNNLAAHYGLPSVSGGLQRVSLAESPRTGFRIPHAGPRADHEFAPEPHDPYAARRLGSQ